MSELKIGDIVKIIGEDCSGKRRDIGWYFQILKYDPVSKCYTDGRSIYPASSLRKLSPDEIPCEEQILAAYKHRLERSEARVDLLVERENAILKRLVAIEKWQREHDETHHEKLAIILRGLL